jgi:hypothetical protein
MLPLNFSKLVRTVVSLDTSVCISSTGFSRLSTNDPTCRGSSYMPMSAAVVAYGLNSNGIFGVSVEKTILACSSCDLCFDFCSALLKALRSALLVVSTSALFYGNPPCC